MKKKSPAGNCLFTLCICWIIFIFFPCVLYASGSTNRILVEFHLNGRPYLITGEKTAPQTYVFNKGAPKKISVTTLNWAPYIGETICRQGWVQQLTIALLASQGYEITSMFLPWARTIMMAETGAADILYPEYFIESTAPSDVYRDTNRVDHLALSRKFPGGPIAFMKRKGYEDRFKGNFFNLKNEKIGVIRGYQNTPEFDAFMDIEFFDISLAIDDLMNAKKLINKRINLIIGDPAVVRFSILSSDLSQNKKFKMVQNIEVVQPVIQYNYLYYAISKKKPGWKNTLKMLNTAMEEFENSGLMFDIIKIVNTTCGFTMEEVLPPYEKNKSAE